MMRIAGKIASGDVKTEESIGLPKMLPCTGRIFFSSVCTSVERGGSLSPDSSISSLERTLMPPPRPTTPAPVLCGNGRVKRRATSMSSISSNAITTVCRGSLVDALMSRITAAPTAPTLVAPQELDRSALLRNCQNDAMGCEESVRALNRTCAYEFCARSCVDAEGNDLFSGVPVTSETCVPETGAAEACAACRAGNASMLVE